MVRKIVVTPYNPDWPGLYQREASLLRTLPDDQVISVHHIGSTAIPGMKAKPIVDVLIVVKRIDQVDAYNPVMQADGYTPKGENGIPGRRYFRKGSHERRTVHAHAFQRGDPEIARHLAFRDHMIAHPEDAEAYGRLKEALVERHGGDVDRYVAGKDAFIREIDRRASVWRDARDYG